MRKKIIIMGLVLSMLFSFVACSKSLESYKENAKEELVSYVEAKGQSNYSIESWSAICEILEEGKKAVDNASKKKDIDKVISAAKTEFDLIKKEKEMGLSAELQTQIKQDYVSSSLESGVSTIDDVSLHRYYGTYNNHVVLALSSITKVIIDLFGGTETVAGKTFYYAQPGYRILVWSEGSFYTLTEAHSQNLLTDGNIETIWSLYQE